MNNQTNTILYRADGNHLMGLGHISRAKSMMSVLLKNGINPILITQSENDVLEPIINLGVTVLQAPSNGDLTQYIIDQSKSYNANLVIQDIKDTSIEDTRKLNSAGLFLVHFDDTGSGRNLADILIDANLSEESINFSKNQKKLFGKKYMVLNEQFSDLNKQNRPINYDIKNILISMGGSDPANLTIEVIKSIHNNIDTSHTHINVVTGKAIKNQQLIYDLCESYGFTHLHNITNMAQLLYKSDIAIISGGITLYEASATGTPSITLPQVHHQTVNAMDFERESITICPFDETGYDEPAFINALNRLYRDFNLRRKMSLNGKKFVDGNGVYRILSTIKDSITKTQPENENERIFTI